jgi:predicted RNA-binding Zn-ribbon protein involved in translation (DUF1610 family)
MERGYRIRSKPTYETLMWHEQALAHIVVAKGSGGKAVLQLFQQMYPKQPVTVFYVRGKGNDPDFTEKLTKLVGNDIKVYDSEMEALYAFYRHLPDCKMGTRFYVAGSETFMWSMCKLANLFDIQEKEIQKEISHSLARPVYCVHCKATTPDVTTNIASCSKCGRKLFVRDHFSRHLGAYMGLMIDAENPGEVPAIEEIYP